MDELLYRCQKCGQYRGACNCLNAQLVPNPQLVPPHSPTIISINSRNTKLEKRLATAQNEIEFLTKALEQAVHLSRMEIDRESDVICFDNDWNSQPNVPELAEYLKRRESNIEAGEGEK